MSAPLLLFTLQLVALDKSKLRGIVNTRRIMMNELGWEPEWEVNPKELQLVERIGAWKGGARKRHRGREAIGGLGEESGLGRGPSILDAWGVRCALGRWVSAKLRASSANPHRHMTAP